MLACYKARAVPINVNYRYVADELRYLCDDADLVALFHDADTTDARRRGPVSRAAAHRDRRLRRVRAARAVGLGRARPRPALPRRPLRALHRRHDRPAEGRRVAPGRHVLRRPRQREPGRTADHRARSRSRRRCSTTPRNGCGRSCRPATRAVTQFVSLALGPLMHASGQWSALGTLLGGGKVVLYGEPHVDMELVLDLLERERVNACNLVGDASARPMLHALTTQPGRWDLSSLRLLGSGGSILSGDVKDGLMAALPSVLAIVEGIGSSESPAQAVAVTTRGGAPSASLTFAAKADTIVVDEATLRPVAPGSGVVGRLATRGRVPLGYHKDPERSARTFVEIDGERWSLPGDMATDRRRRHDPPARPRRDVHQHRRREGVPRRGRGRAEEPPGRGRRGRARRARRALRPAGGRRRSRSPAVEPAPDLDALQAHCRVAPRGLQGAACAARRRTRSRARPPARPTTRGRARSIDA